MDAVRSAVKRGADELYIVPVFLAKASIQQKDIPNEVGGFKTAKVLLM